MMPAVPVGRNWHLFKLQPTVHGINWELRIVSSNRELSSSRSNTHLLVNRIKENVHLHSLIHNDNHTLNHIVKPLFLFEKTEKKTKTNIEGLELITAYREIKKKER